MRVNCSIEDSGQHRTITHYGMNGYDIRNLLPYTNIYIRDIGFIRNADLYNTIHRVRRCTVSFCIAYDNILYTTHEVGFDGTIPINMKILTKTEPGNINQALEFSNRYSLYWSYNDSGNTASSIYSRHITYDIYDTEVIQTLNEMHTIAKAHG